MRVEDQPLVKSLRVEGIAQAGDQSVAWVALEFVLSHMAEEVMREMDECISGDIFLSVLAQNAPDPGQPEDEYPIQITDLMRRCIGERTSSHFEDVWMRYTTLRDLVSHLCYWALAKGTQFEGYSRVTSFLSGLLGPRGVEHKGLFCAGISYFRRSTALDCAGQAWFQRFLSKADVTHTWHHIACENVAVQAEMGVMTW